MREARGATGTDAAEKTRELFAPQTEFDLAGYLPPFMAAYWELTGLFLAEEPELAAVWRAVSRTAKNAFLLTADEAGLARFEKLLGIAPEPGETLEARRARVLARWINELPYTERVLRARLAALTGGRPFSLLWLDAWTLSLEIELAFGTEGLLDELRRVLAAIVPCNIAVHINNRIRCVSEGALRFSGGVCFTSRFTLTDRAGRRGANAAGLSAGQTGGAGAARVIITERKGEGNG